MARDPAARIARLAPATARAAVRDSLVAEPAADLPAPQALLRGDAWTGVLTTADPDGYRGVLVTAGGRRSTSRSCTIVDHEGRVAALLPADDAARRAAAIAVAIAAPRIVRPGPLRLALLGAGPLARLCVEELRTAVDVAEARVYDDDPAVLAAVDFADAARDAQSAVRDADLIVTATNARDPVLRADWVGEGAAVIALGADRRGRRELDYRLIADATFVACDAVAVARALADDLRDCVADGHLDWQEVTPLRDVLTGEAEARVKDDDRVIVKLVDPAPGVLALARAALGS